MWIPQPLNLPFADPPFAVPDLLIHCTTARAAKVWPFNHWRQVLDVADANGWSVGLVGSPPAAQKEAYNSGDGEDSLLQTTGVDRPARPDQPDATRREPAVRQKSGDQR